MRISGENISCSMAYLRKKATPKNRIMTPIVTTVLTPMNMCLTKFQNGEGSAGFAAGPGFA